MADTSSLPDADLFDFDARVLPLALPSETLYSWCARFHRLSGNAHIRTTSRWLFGHPSLGLRHDFPVRLDYFSAATREHLGRALDVIYERTHFGLFAPFLSPSVRDQIVEAMRVPGSQAIRRKLGVNRSGLGEATPWKVCRHCLEEDRERAPSGGWRLLYQYPSVWFCQKHQAPLWWCPDWWPGGATTDWYLPADCAIDALVPPAIESRHQSTLNSLVDWTSAITALRSEFLDASLLRYTYLLRTMALGWVAMDGSLRFHMLRDAFRRDCAGLAQLPGFLFLDATAGINGGFLGQLVRDYPGARHPLKHLLLMAFLFEAPSQFFDAYAATRDVAVVDGVDGLRKQLTATQVRLRKLVGSDGKSVNSACLELGIQPSQAIRHLKASGAEYRKRSRVLTVALKAELDARLQFGEGRDEIAIALGVRKSFIKDYLAERQELRIAWDKAHRERARANYRAHFLQVLAEHPGVPIKRVRRISGCGFQWLYRNDKEWLISQLPQIWRRSE